MIDVEVCIHAYVRTYVHPSMHACMPLHYIYIFIDILIYIPLRCITLQYIAYIDFLLILDIPNFLDIPTLL